MFGFLRRIRNWMPRRKPLSYAVRYVEPDGTREIDIKCAAADAESWAEWCRQDGCSQVEIHPLYTDDEITLALYRVVEVVPAAKGTAG